MYRIENQEMESTSVLSGLNEEQKAAVLDIENACLILAGAGTGKTKTITHKIAYILQKDKDVSPNQIVMLTFTKAAAEEMLNRAKSLHPLAKNVVGGTFHSYAYHIMKKDYQAKSQIIDEEDQERIFKIILEANNNDKRKVLVYEYDNTKLIASLTAEFLKEIYNYFSESNTSYLKSVLKLVMTNRLPPDIFVFEKNKNRSDIIDFITSEICTEEEIEHILSNFIGSFFEQYKNYKINKNILDFSDILINFYNALKNGKIKLNIKYLIVDEYQDVSDLQANIVIELAKICNNRVTVVGDEAQSIYSFRSANYYNIISFARKISGCKIYKLTRNYRSVQEILDLANELLHNNAKYLTKNSYLKKSLFSNRNGYKPIIVEVSEPVNTNYSKKVVEFIVQEMKEKRMIYSEVAILARNSFTLDMLEGYFRASGIPYEKRGGKGFFERKHVKNFMALFSFIGEMPASDFSFYRFIELLKGVGEKTAHEIYQELKEDKKYNFEKAIEYVTKNKKIREKENAVKLFKKLDYLYLEYKNKNINMKILSEMLRNIFIEILTGHEGNVRKKRDIDIVTDFASNYESIESFLEAIYFLDNGLNTENNSIILSTVHAAKGLEWDSVFIVNVFDGVFPSKKAYYITGTAEQEETMDEELRLLYVAVTRAKENLYIINPAKAYSTFLSSVHPNLFMRMYI